MGHIQGKQAYLNLQKRLDKMPIGTPAHPALFALLEELFTTEECHLAASMPMKLSTAETIAKNAGYDSKRAESMLNDLTFKGLVFDIESPEGLIFYALNPAVVGFFEFTMMRVREDIDQTKAAKLMHEYFQADSSNGFTKEFISGETFVARPLVHENALEPEVFTEVLDYEKATSIIESSKSFAEGICYCRHTASHLGHDCKFPQTYCLSFGMGAEYLIRTTMAKRIEKNQALDILIHSRELGLVQMADNVKNKPGFICNCCKCCCGMLAGFRTVPDFTKVITSNYIATIDEDQCSGCRRCAKACPVNAIEMLDAQPTEKNPKRIRKAAVKNDPCLGCGVCHGACKDGAVTMKPIGERVYTPENMMDKMIRQAIEHNKLQYMLFTDQTKVTHRILAAFVGALLKLPPAKQLLAKQQIKSKFIHSMMEGFKNSKNGWLAKL